MADLFKSAKHLEPFLVLEYAIDADKESVFNAWTDIELFQKWFCPTGFSIAKVEMLPEAGGFFTVHMKSPEGQIYPTKGEYILLEKPNRIVYKDSWDDDRKNNEPILTEVQFEQKNKQTILKLFSSFNTTKQKETVMNSGVAAGWKMFFQNLNSLIGNK